MIIKMSAILLLLQWTTNSMSIPTYDITREEKRSVGNSGSSHFEQSNSYKSSSSSHEVKAETSQTYHYTSHKSSEGASQVTVENHHKDNGKFEHATSEESKYVVTGEYTLDKNTQNNKHSQKFLIHENQHDDDEIQHKFHGSLSETGKHFKDLTNGLSKVIKIREPNQFHQNIGQSGVKISVTQDEQEQNHSNGKETRVVINLNIPQTDGSIVVAQSGSENDRNIVSGKHTKKIQHTSLIQNQQTFRKGKMLMEHEKMEGNMHEIIERHGESHSGLKVATKEIHVQRNNHKESSHQTHPITNIQHHNTIKKNQRKAFLSETQNTSKRERDLHQNMKERHVEGNNRVKINKDVINVHLNNKKESSHRIHTINNFSKREGIRHQDIIERHIESNDRIKINKDHTRKESSHNNYVDFKSNSHHKEGIKIEQHISRNENRETSKDFKDMHSNREKIEHHQNYNQNSEHHSYGSKKEQKLSFGTSKDTFERSASTKNLMRKEQNQNTLKDFKNSHRHTLNEENGKDITITITGDIDQLTDSNKASYHDMSSSQHQKQHIHKKESIRTKIENASSKQVTEAESIHQRKHDHIVDLRQVGNFQNNNNKHHEKQDTDIFIEDMGSNIEEKGRGSYHTATSKSEEINHNTQSRKYTKLNEHSKKNDKEIVVVATDDLDSETNNLAKESYYKTVSKSEGHQYHNREESRKQTKIDKPVRHIGLDNGKDVTMTSYETVAKFNSDNKYKNQRSTNHYSDDEGDIIVTVQDSDTKNHGNQYHKQKENGYHRYKQQGNGVRHSGEDKTDVIVTIGKDVDTKVHENQYRKQEANEKYTSLIKNGKISTDSSYVSSNLELSNQHKNTHSKVLDSDLLQELVNKRSKNSDDVRIIEEQKGEYKNRGRRHHEKQGTDIIIEDMGSNIEEKGRGSYHKATSKSEEIKHNTQSRKYTKLNEYNKKNDKEIVVVATDDLDSETNNLAKDSYYKAVSKSEGHQYHNRERSGKQTNIDKPGRHIGLDNGKDVTMTSYETVAKFNSDNKYKNQRSTSHYSDDEGDIIVTVQDSDTKNHGNQYKQKENGYHRYKQQGNGIRHSEEDKADVIVTIGEDIDTKVHENQYKQEANEKYTSLIQTGKISTDSSSNLELNNQHKNNQRRYRDNQKEIVAEHSYTHSSNLDSDSLQEFLKRHSKNSDDVTIIEGQKDEYENGGRRHMVKSKDQSRFNINNSQDFGTAVTEKEAKDIDYSVQVFPETKSKYNTNGGQVTITLDDDLGGSTTRYVTKSKSIINPANSHSFTKSFEKIGGDTYHVDVDQDFSPNVGKIVVRTEKIVQPPTVIVENSYGRLNNDGIDENAMSHSSIHSTANYLERSAKHITKQVVSGVHGEKNTGTGSGIINGDIGGPEIYEVDDVIGTQLPGDRLKGNIHRNSNKGTLIKTVGLDGDMLDTQEEWKMDPLEPNSKLRPTRSISFTLPEDNFGEFKSTSFQQSGKKFGQQQRTITVSGNSGQKYQIYQKSQPLVWSVQSSGQEVNGQGSGYIQQSYPDGNVKFSSVKWNSQGINPGEQKFTFSQKISDNGDLLNDQFGKIFEQLMSTSNTLNTIGMSKQVGSLDSFPINLGFQSSNDDLFFNHHFNIGNNDRNKVQAFEQIRTLGQPEITSEKDVNVKNILQSKDADQSDFDLSTLLDLMRQPSDQQSGKFLQISQQGSAQSEQPLELITKATSTHRNKVQPFEQMSTIGQPEIASEKIVTVNNIRQSKDADQSDFDLSTLLDLMRQPSDQQTEKFLKISQQGSVQSEQPLELITKATSTQLERQPQYVNTSPVLDLLTQPADQKPGKMLQTTQHRSFLTEQPTEVIIKTSTKEFGQSIPQRHYLETTFGNKRTDFQKNLNVEDLLDIFNKHSNQISNGQQTQRNSAFAQQPIKFMTLVTNHQTAQIIPPKQFTTTKLNGFELQSKDTKEPGFQDQSNHKALEFGNSLQFGAKQLSQPSNEVVQQDSGIRLNNLQIDQPYSLLNKAINDQSNQIIQQADDQKYVKHLYGLNELFDKQPKMTNNLEFQENLVGKHQQQISNDMLQQNSAVNNLFKKTTTHESSKQIQQSSEHKSRHVESDQLQYAEQPFSVLRRQTEESNHQSEKSNKMEHASSHTSLQIGDGSRPFEVVSTQTNHKVTKVEHSSKSEKRSTQRVTVQGPIQQVVGG
ncbi:unnamed protein product [Diabrotica balteata]|uniref:Uncharacterized protein n=1 Tax=Diabrotica balteata TaxID=107213 RepID=A0A9N9XFW0_DIABA|nr:unnamed protein product [Diabrotica balteata]